MREKSITGKYIGNAIGYCHCNAHTGALNKELACKHKCIAKLCKWLEVCEQYGMDDSEYGRFEKTYIQFLKETDSNDWV